MQVGKRFWSDIRGFPGSMSQLLRHDGDAALGHVLWGVAGSMMVASALAPAVSLVFAAGLLALMGGLLRTIVTGLLMVVWRAVVGAIAPNRRQPPKEAALGVVMLGVALGFAASYAISSPVLKILAGLVAAGLAFVLTTRKKPNPVVTAILLGLAGAVLFAISREIHALAADGGWRENGSDPGAWLRGGGLGVISDSTPAALFGAGGGLLGPGLTNSADNSQLTEDQVHDKYRDRYIKIHGNDDGFEDWWNLTGHHTQTTGQKIMDNIPSWMRNFDYGGFIRSEGQDFASGDIAKRLWALDQGMVNSFFEQANKQVIEPLMVAGDFWAHPSRWGDAAVLAGPAGDGLKTAFDFWKGQGLDGVRQVGGELSNLSQEAWNGMQGKMNEFEDAVARGDNEKASKMIGELAGNAEFQALMLKGPGAASQKFAELKAATQEARALQEAQAARGLGHADILYGPEGQVLTAEDMARIGVDPERVKALQATLKPGEELHLKPGSEEAIAWRDSGATGKPVEIKAKSGNEYDQYIKLGGPNDSGLVTYGAPEAPVRPPGMSAAKWADIEPEVNARYAQKLQEFHDQAASMQKMATEGVDMNVNGTVQRVKIDWRGGGEINGKPFGDGVVYAITSDGTRIPIAGDVDMFTFKGGSSSTEMYPKLAQAEPGIAHHADTPNWNPDDPKLLKVKDAVLWDHAANNPNAQNVIKLTNNSISTTLGPAVHR